MANFQAAKFGKIVGTSEFWTKHPDMEVKDLTPEQMAAAVAEVAGYNTQIDELEKQKKELDAKRDATYAVLLEINTRVRKAAVGYLGTDSTELRALGLKPKSEHKTPVRKPKKEKAVG